MEPTDRPVPIYLRAHPAQFPVQVPVPPPPFKGRRTAPVCWTEGAAARAVTCRHYRCAASRCRARDATTGSGASRTPSKLLKKSESSPQLFNSQIWHPEMGSLLDRPVTSTNYLLLPRPTNVTDLTGTAWGGVFRSGWATTPSPKVAREQYLLYMRTEVPHRLPVWIPPALLVDGEKADLEAKTTRKLYTDLLQREATLVKDLDAILAQKEELDLRRKELLHKKWSDNVYEPIRREINREMDGPGYLELMQRKCQQHKEFLELINRKGHVFLDTIDPEEYYAMSLYPNKNAALVAKTKALQDPLLIQERELTQEDRVVHQCTTGSVLSDRELNDLRLPRFPLMPLMPLGRHGTGCRQWIDMPLANIESTVRKASRCRFKSKPKAPQTDIMRWSSEDQQPKKVVLAQYLAGDQRRSNRLIVDNCGGQDLGGNEAGGSLSVY